MTGLDLHSLKKESLILKNIKKKYNYKDRENIQSNFEIISYYLNNIFKKNNISIQKILSSNEIKNKNYKGFYTIELSHNSYEFEILKIFFKLTKNLPLSFTLLICTNLTSEEELNSFLYRAFYSDSNILFLLQNIEELSNFKRKRILKMLNDENLLKNMKSTLVITFCSQTTDIYKSIIKLEGHKKLNEVEKGLLSNNILNNIKKLIDKVFTVSSNSSGVGKSFYIKQKAKSDNLDYIYFPIGGSYNKEEVIKRLNELSSQRSFDNCIFHLDISETDNDNLTREILFALPILYKYGHNDNTVCLSKNMFIYIEIPFGFSNFKERFQIINIFKQIELNIQNLPPLIDNVNQKKVEDSDIQVVAGILYLFDNQLIINQGIDLNSNKRINIHKCQDLIRKYFNIKNPNYYQINTFIKVMSYQCRNFLESTYLSIEELRLHNLLNIRQFMIDALIKITKSFIDGVFKRLITSQTESINYIVKGNDNRRDIALEVLTKEQDMISFDKFKPSLIFFNEDKQSLSIITSCSNDEEEYKNLEKLYNSQSRKGQKYKLLDYKTLNSDEILLEIKKVLNINNATLKELKQYTNSYVFTADNFIKLILILTRTRANIPVIMMGETGCGKTSLLRVLSKLQNKGELKMKIKNIHAGTEEEDIIQFLEKTEKELVEEEEALINIEKIEFDENKKYYKKKKKKFYNTGQYFFQFRNNLPKLWVFFDEINTCNCLGLISEILCNHTYRGKSIKDNIVFFAACNPYRFLKNESEDIGLINRKKFIKRKYVYSVNPLPHSLLNFVFDFGNLKKEDEERYINSMVEKTFEICYKSDINNLNEYKKIAKLSSECISICQNFIREFQDISSVSLREVRRFDLLFKWFIDYFNIKKEVLNEESERYKKLEIRRPNNIINF